MKCTAVRVGDEKALPLPSPGSLEVMVTCASPARQATLTFAAEQPLPPLSEIRLHREDGAALFAGAVDEQVFSHSRAGGRLLLSARSRSGVLLDNEALPASYNRPDLQAMFLLHAAPYGLCAARGEGRCPGVYHVGKGQSEWEVLSDFCSYVCGWRPRVTADGVLEAHAPGRRGAHVFSNQSAAGIRFTALKRVQKPYGVISEVRYRPDRGSGYLYTMKQGEALPAPRARRFLNLAQAPSWRGRREAELLLRRSLAGSEELALEAPYSFSGELGDAAHAPDAGCAPGRDDWCIWSMRYHRDAGGAGCTVTLRPRTHF